MLKGLISHLMPQPGVRFATLEEVAADFSRCVPRNRDVKTAAKGSRGARGGADEACRVDVGGTFTDLVFADTETGSIVIHKVSTKPEDPSIGVAEGVATLCNRAGLPRSAVDHVLHGTTIAANAALEHRGAECGLITTRGYRDIGISAGTRGRSTIRYARGSPGRIPHV